MTVALRIQFFRDNRVPFWEMANADELVGNPQHDNSRYCFAKADELYLVYLPRAGRVKLDLSRAQGHYQVRWFNPRQGGKLMDGSVTDLAAGRPYRWGSRQV